MKRVHGEIEVPVELVYHGDRHCEFLDCTNGAYFAVMLPGAVVAYQCGVHSKKNPGREPLPKRSRAEIAARSLARTVLRDTHHRAVLDGSWRMVAPGHLTCVRIVGRGKLYPLDPAQRVINIFPNNFMTDRADGICMPELSPMRLGPVNHGEPGVPVALSIENYHQFSKCWPSEIDPVTSAPLPAWYVCRDAGFRDPVPHRHKFDAAQMKKERKAAEAMHGSDENHNAPAYAFHLSRDHTGRRFTYVESRFFYCVAYEALALARPEFAQLVEWREREGASLAIHGYDAFPLGEDANAEALYRAYIDPTLPFGHERVLYALLALHGKSRDLLPWRRYAREHPVLYARVPYHGCDAVA
jgi:hypothetical protein